MRNERTHPRKRQQSIMDAPGSPCEHDAAGELDTTGAQGAVLVHAYPASLIVELQHRLPGIAHDMGAHMVHKV